MPVDHATLFHWAAHHHLALFPIPAGRKAPGNLVRSHSKDWSLNPEQWALWSQSFPGCNFGIECGPSDLIVVDPDQPVTETWPDFVNWLRSGGIADEPAFVVSTPTGGFHCYYRTPGGLLDLRQPDIIKGKVNVRAGAGYVVAPWCETLVAAGDGDVKADGIYQIIRGDAIPPAPQILLNHCQNAQGGGLQTLSGDLRPDGYPSDPGLRSRVQQIVNNAVGILEGDGVERNNALNEQAGDLYRLVAKGQLDEDTMREALIDAMHRNGYVIEHDLQNVINTLDSAKRFVETGAIENKGTTGNRTAAEAFGAPTGPPVEVVKPLISPWETWNHGDADLPAPSWTIKNVLPHRALTLLVAQYSAGKSTVCVAMALSIMTGMRFAGNRIKQTGGVVFIAAEAPGVVNYSYKAHCEDVYANALQGNDEKGETVIKVLFDTDAPKPPLDKMPFTMLMPDQGMLDDHGKPREGAQEEMKLSLDNAKKYLMEKHGVPLRLIVIDTLAVFARWEDENKAAQVINIMKMLENVAMWYDCAVLVADHTGLKGTRARGSSAKEDNSSAVLRIIDERDEYDIISSRRLHVSKAKGSMGAGRGVSFDIVPIERGVDEDGDPITAGIAVWDKWGEPPKGKAQKVKATEVSTATEGQQTVAYPVAKSNPVKH